MRQTRLSLYYPFALTRLVGYRKCEDHEASGETLLIFEDTAHCHVSIRLDRQTLRELAERIGREPDGAAD